MEDKPSPSDPEPQNPAFQSGRLSPELREYFLRELTEEEEKRMLADLQEIRETGGLQFEDFIGELEELVNTLEPPPMNRLSPIESLTPSGSVASCGSF